MRLTSTLLVLLFTFPLYSQTAPAVRRITAVQNVSLTGDSILSSEDFQQVVSDIQRNRYSRNVETSIADVARRSLGNLGYFKAEVSTVATEVLNETTRTRTVAVTVHIREGEQYRVSHITFANNKTFSEAELRREFPINDGDVMSERKIEEGLRKMRHLCASKGYMEITPVPEIVADDASRTLSIKMDVDEGPQFKVRGLTLEGDKEWPADKAQKLQALSASYVGSHNVGDFIDDVKKLLTDMFPSSAQIDSLVGQTMGGEQHLVTLNVRYPSGEPN